MTTTPPPLPPSGPEVPPSASVPPPPQALFAACPTCGSQVTYAPGTAALKCEACGAEHPIQAGEDTTVDEHSFDEWMGRHAQVKVATLVGQVLRCQGCGAQVETSDLAATCQFCSGHLIALSTPEGVVEPEAVVPFEVARGAAQKAFKEWVGSRWFAPNALKKIGSTESLAGTYVPHWTFDARTATDYDGERGEHYYVTKTRQVSDGKGGTKTETYQERHTRWYDASGNVTRAFDDVMVPASRRLDRKRLDQMGPWKLDKAVAYQPEYLSGYSALRYDVDPQEGSTEARQEMREAIEEDVRHDIGGDEQRVHHMDVTYSQVLFKLVLLPLWLATYVHAGKQWQVSVNANTGKVTGDRPYSVIKITLAVLAALIVLALVALVVLSMSDSSASGAGLRPPTFGTPTSATPAPA
jgi:Zn finger protein HypA/HybF involved in hydrogenase expression